ncbi:MAG: STAS domain-containing protein [Kiritimatiellae bacterium]|nr:STAS domain-containing protein [Kiritimatiellia bacterium]MDD4734675.1 STAS domain-containing protein [Kiritimatiellia bacterium]
MKLDLVHKNSGVILRVDGALDHATAQKFAKKCYELLSLNAAKIAIDLRKADFVGSASVCTIVAVGKKIQARQGEYYLSLSSPAEQALEFSGFKSVFSIVDDPEAVID